MPHVKQSEDFQYLLVLEVRGPSLWTEMDMSHHAAEPFVELSDEEKNEA